MNDTSGRLLQRLRGAVRWPALRRVATALGVGLVTLCLGLAVGSTVERRMLGERVLPRVTVWGVDYGGWEPERVQADLQRRKAQWQERPCVVVVKQREFSVAPRDVGFDFDVERAVAEVAAAGRTGSWWRGFTFRIARLWGPTSIEIDAAFNVERLRNRVKEWQSRAISDPPVEAEVRFEAGKVQGIAPKAGTQIAFDRMPKIWLHAIRIDSSPVLRVELPLEQHAPTLSQSALEQAVAQANALVAAPIVLTHDWGELVFTPAQLGAALQSQVINKERLEVTLLLEVIDRELSPLRVALERPAGNARFVVDKDDRVQIEPSSTARRVVTAEVVDALWKSSTTHERKALLPVREVDEATLTTAQAEALGIQKRVSTFVTYFPCCQPRVKNIQRMADLLDGTVLRPGETFSVNEKVGERTQARGFVAGPTIVAGEMEDTFGGGVSQFATTLFNAVLQGGYQIVERQAHSYYFPRYPMGHEATLSFPKPDLIFRNDTQFGLLILARTTKTSIRVLLYGDNEGRLVERKSSAAFDFTEPPVDYIPDDKLKPDEHKEKERGSRGFSVTVTRIITFSSGEKKEEARRVVYKPRQAVVATHPCNIPKEDEDHTGEACPEVEPEEQEETQSEGQVGDHAIPLLPQ